MKRGSCTTTRAVREKNIANFAEAVLPSLVLSSKLLLALASTVVLGFRPRREPSPILCLSKTVSNFENSVSSTREGVLSFSVDSIFVAP
jgi:uncharacterized membrane protein affecting hemolysin expression